MKRSVVYSRIYDLTMLLFALFTMHHTIIPQPTNQPNILTINTSYNSIVEQMPILLFLFLNEKHTHTHTYHAEQFGNCYHFKCSFTSTQIEWWNQLIRRRKKNKENFKKKKHENHFKIFKMLNFSNRTW